MKIIIFGIIFLLLSPTIHALEIRVPLASSEINFDPTKQYDQSSLWVERQIHCQLTRKQQGKVALEAASSINYLSTHELQVRLGNNYKFYDGTPITADDVVATFEFLKKERTSYKAQFGLVDRVLAIDTNTLIFKFKEPTAKLFLDFFSTSHNPIMPKEFIERAKKNKTILETPMGCGNYKISEYIPTDHISLIPLKKNFPNIIFFLQKANQVSGDQMNKYDLVYLPIENFDKYKTKILKDFRVASVFDPYHIVLSLNATMEPWKNEANRCSLFSSLDTIFPIKEYEPNVKSGDDIFPKGVLGYNSISNYQLYYKNKGIKLPSLNHTFCLSFNNVSIPEMRRPSYLKMFKKNYSNIKVKEIVNPKTFGPTFLQQQCDAIIIGFKSNNLDGADFLDVFTENSVNYTGYWDTNLKRNIIDAQQIDDPNRRSDAFHNLSNEIRNKCLIYPILTIPYKNFYVKRNLKFPDIEKSILNEYFLGDVSEEK